MAHSGFVLNEFNLVDGVEAVSFVWTQHLNISVYFVWTKCCMKCQRQYNSVGRGNFFGSCLSNPIYANTNHQMKETHLLLKI